MNLASALLLLVSILGSSQMSAGQATSTNAFRDPSPHHREMITVDQGIQLEVLDWGGTGRPLVFLSGLGNTAHYLGRRSHVSNLNRNRRGKSQNRHLQLSDLVYERRMSPGLT